MIDIKYIFSLELYQNNGYKTVGFFNKIEGLSRKVDDENQIQLSDGFILEPFHKIKKIKDCDIYINMYDSQFNCMTNFESGTIEKIEILHQNDSLEVILIGEHLPIVSYETMSLWFERRNGFPVKKGIWLKLPHNQRQNWLEVSLLDRRFKYKNYKNAVIIELDGKIIDDINSFYCAFGEAVHGAGGYMGRSYHGVYDCLTGGCGTFVSLPLTVIWSNSDYSQKVWVSDEECNKYIDLIEYLRRQKDYIILELQ